MYDLGSADLGDLDVPSGRLAIGDAMTSLDSPVVVDVPAGRHLVRIAVALDRTYDEPGVDHAGGLGIWDDDVRPACLSVIVAAGEPATVTGWVAGRGEVDYAALPGEDEIGVGPPVDSGLVAVRDAAAALPDGMVGRADEMLYGSDARTHTDRLQGDRDHHTGLFTLGHGPDSPRLAVMDAEEGDGPVLLTRAADGRLLGVHVLGLPLRP